jgi:hypothetical protein
MKKFRTNLMCFVLLISVDIFSGCSTCQQTSHSTQDAGTEQNDYAWWQYVLGTLGLSAYSYAKENAENQSQRFLISYLTVRRSQPQLTLSINR